MTAAFEHPYASAGTGSGSAILPTDEETTKNLGLGDFSRRGQVAWKSRSGAMVLMAKCSCMALAEVERAGARDLAMPAFAITMSILGIGIEDDVVLWRFERAVEAEVGFELSSFRMRRSLPCALGSERRDTEVAWAGSRTQAMIR